MYNRQYQLMFDTLEGYEDFINGLLQKETELTANPSLDWEEALTNKNLLL